MEILMRDSSCCEHARDHPHHARVVRSNEMRNYFDNHGNCDGPPLFFGAQRLENCLKQIKKSTAGPIGIGFKPLQILKRRISDWMARIINDPLPDFGSHDLP